MEAIRKSLIGQYFSNKHFKNILICEENIEMLKNVGADVFEKPKKDKVKYKGIKENDVKSNEE